MENIFPRQQAIELSGLSSGQLSRLDKAGIVSPHKLGSITHPTVLYDLNQVMELRAIASLRQKLSMQEVKKVIQHLRQHRYDSALFGKFLVFCNDKLYLVEPGELGQKVIELSGKNKGQVVFKAVHPIGDVISGLQKEVEKHEALESENPSQRASSKVH